ncbi:MAG: hypothetical protein ACWGPR_08625, partial [Candidatus Deferrimicrobiaceae bacterium]
ARRMGCQMPTDHALRELEQFLANVDYERSTMGPFLDRLKLFGGAAETPTRPKRTSARFRPRPKPGDRALPKTCRKCEAVLAGETCDACGWSHTLRMYRVTALITAETHASQAQPPNEDRLVRYARASRRFAAFEREHPRLATVLAAYYGSNGMRYEPSAYRPFNRLLAVMPLTPEGASLCERVVREKLNGADTDPERLRMLHAQRKLKDRVSLAAGQALKLHKRALALYLGREDGEDEA